MVVTSWAPYLNAVLPYFTIIFLCWLTYCGIIKGFWVSDDVAGISQYDGKMQKPFAWGNALKKFRYEFGKKISPDAGKWNDDKDHTKGKKPDFISDHRAHHRLNIYFLTCACILLYHFLANVLNPSLALWAVCLFIVHPVGVQAVGWISGIGYVTSLMFTAASLNIAFYVNALKIMNHPYGCIAALALFGILQYAAMQGMFSAVGIILVLALLGYWPFAVLALLIGLYGCRQTLKDAVTLRKKAFEEQQMSASTKFHWKKLIIVPKTFQYYVRLVFWPHKLGLYHAYGYHYKLPEIETEDKDFVLGIALFIAGAALVIFAPFPIKLAVVWFFSFLLVFMNWVTANQFVAERYVWSPSLGICIAAAFLLHSMPSVLALLLGLMLMRTWMHLPTYYDEILFYQSNIWNFPDSEVAFGNLGVIFMNAGLMGSAVDSWQIGSRLNPQYDVNWYNLYSVHKTEAVKQQNKQILLQARGYLVNAISSRTCHFPEQWKKELDEVDKALAPAVVNTATVLKLS